MKTKSKKQTKISSTPNSVSTPTPHQESVNTIPKVVANELQTDESTNNQTISITIGFPNNEQRQYQVNLDYLVMDLKTIITASQQSQEYSCFDLYSKGSEKLPLLVQLKDVIDIQSNDRLLFLKPALYTTKDIHLHIQKFREVVSVYESSLQSDGIDYSASYFSTLTNPNKSQTYNIPLVIGQVDLLVAFPLTSSKSTSKPKACVKSITLSSWSPVEESRFLMGDLIYLTVETLEGHIIEITGSAHGFFCSKTTDSKFDPDQKTKPVHSLSDCLASLSPSFESHYATSSEYIRNLGAYETGSSNKPFYPWCVRTPIKTKSAARTLDFILESDFVAIQCSKDWNEDMQTARDLPKSTPTECIIQDQCLLRQHYDYKSFATKTAQSIIDGKLQVLNMSDCPSLEMYLYANVFLSSGFDPRGHLSELGRSNASHAASSKDIDGLSLVTGSKIQDVHCLDTVMIDYCGKRMIAQTIIPGILKKFGGDGSPVKYGLVDDDHTDTFDDDPQFHASFLKLGQQLKLKSRTISDAQGQKRTFATSLESKGILGNDGRKYILDTYRFFPVDIEFLESCQKESTLESGNEFDYPHQICLVRGEAIEIYLEYKHRIFEKEAELKMTKELDANGESPAPVVSSSRSNEERPINPYSTLSFNTDCFTPTYQKYKLTKEEGQDEHEIRELSKFVGTLAVETLIIEIVNYPSLIPMDSDTLTASMHRRGINMRFLGKLSGILETIESDSLNLLKNVIREEMILRAMKHIIRDLLVNLAKPFTGPCVAHILNCFFSKESDILVVHDDCHSYSCITPGSLKGMIRLQVRQRFRHDCSEIDHTFSQTHGYALLKGICKKIGIQIQARVYSFVKPDFTQNDILNFHPIVKTIEIHSDFADNALENGRTLFLNDEKETGIQVVTESITIYEQTIGPIHPDTGKAYAQLAMMFFKMNRIKEAKTYQQKACIAYERTLGIDDPATLHQYISMGSFEDADNNTELGISLLEFCSHSFSLLCGDDIHLDRASCHSQLASMYQKSGINGKAMFFYHSSLSTHESIYGKDHPSTISLVDAIGRLSSVIGDYKQALNCERRVYGFYLKNFGKDSPQTIDLGRLLEELTVSAVAQAKERRIEAHPE